MSEEPLHEPQLEKLQLASEVSIFKKYTSLLAIMVVAGGMAFSLLPSGIFDKKSDNTLTPPLEVSSSGDNISEAERLTIESNFMRYTGALQPVSIDNAEIRHQFTSANYYNAETREQIIANIQTGEKKLGSITLWDNFDQDGDIVQIQTGGVVITVPVAHLPTTFLIPYKPGQPLLITGVHDGGGGITAAIATNSGEVPLPVITIGQTIELPLL